MHIAAVTFQTLGTVLIGVTALRVHHRVLFQKKIDARVQRDFKIEQWLGTIGIVSIVVGYFVELSTYLTY